MEAPALWVAKSLCILAPIVSRWRDRGYGVQLSPEASELLVNHWLWADNVMFVASRREDMLAMLTDLTIAIHRHGFRLKESSLEYLACGCPGPPSAPHIAVSLGDDEKSCNPKGEVVRPQEHTHTSLSLFRILFR
eukprot:8560091-Pyramimonas_sp.AAC.1